MLHGLQWPYDGVYPYSGLAFDNAGNLYGTTNWGGVGGYGTVFMLSPPTRKQSAWTYKVLFSFSDGPDGGQPASGVTLDAFGNLYGTTYGGGLGAGTVYKLSPPDNGQEAWTETVLYSFTNGADGGFPLAEVVLDGLGNLYGTTIGGYSGNVFELLAPLQGQSTWNERVLYSFKGKPDGAAPRAPVTFDPEGNLYGTTAGGGRFNLGTVFELKSPVDGKGAWVRRLLHDFKGHHDGATPESRVILGPAGGVYGTTLIGGRGGYGSVFSLEPPVGRQAAWMKTILATFDGKSDGGQPNGVIFDSAGDLFGTAAESGKYGCGTAFMVTLSQRTRLYSTKTTLKQFNCTDGAVPLGSLVFDSSGSLYGTTMMGGPSGNGTIFKLSR